MDTFNGYFYRQREPTTPHSLSIPSLILMYRDGKIFFRGHPAYQEEVSRSALSEKTFPGFFKTIHNIRTGALKIFGMIANIF